MALKEKALYLPNMEEIIKQMNSKALSQVDLTKNVTFERDGKTRTWSAGPRTLSNLFSPSKRDNRKFEGRLFIILAIHFSVGEETLIRMDAPVTDPSKGVLQFFDFGKADDALKALLPGLQSKLKAQKVRVVCFTGHLLEGFFGDLMDKGLGIASVEIFMGTQETARRLEMTRQKQIFHDWWDLNSKDLLRHFARKSGKPEVSVRFFDCPPTFTGVALDDSAYLIVNYLYLPTLDWLRKKSAAKHDHYWQSMGIPNVPEDDDATLNALAMPAVLVVKGDGSGPNEDAFRVYARIFETVWKTLERDWHRPPGKGRYEPFAEMTRLLFSQKTPGGGTNGR